MILSLVGRVFLIIGGVSVAHSNWRERLIVHPTFSNAPRLRVRHEIKICSFGEFSGVVGFLSSKNETQILQLVSPFVLPPSQSGFSIVRCFSVCKLTGAGVVMCLIDFLFFL